MNLYYVPFCREKKFETSFLLAGFVVVLFVHAKFVGCEVSTKTDSNRDSKYERSFPRTVLFCIAIVFSGYLRCIRRRFSSGL